MLTELAQKKKSETDDNGNAVFQSFLSKLLRSTVLKKKKKRLNKLSYRRYGEHGIFSIISLGLFVHPAVRGGTCACTLKIVNTLIKNNSRDDRPSIST